MSEEKKKRPGRPTGTTKIFEKDFNQINKAYSEIRIKLIKYFTAWNENNPTLEKFVANDLYIMAYFHFCIPEKLNPPDLGVDQTGVQDRLKEILYPYLKSVNELTEEAYVSTISDEKNISIFLQRLAAARYDNPEVIPYVIPGTKTTLKNLLDAGYIKLETKLKLGDKSEKFDPTIISHGKIEIKINGERIAFNSPRDAAIKGIGFKGFDNWKSTYVLEDDGKLMMLDHYRELFEREKPFPAHFDSPVNPKQNHIAVLPEKSLIANNDEFYEGSIDRISIEVRERNAGARKACIAQYEAKCFICEFDFGRFYGPEAKGFIHVHHMEKLGESKGQRKVDPAKDLRPLCPNCHSVVHLRKEPYSIDEVRIMIEIAKKQKEP